MHGSSPRIPRCFAKSNNIDRDLARQNRVVSSERREFAQTAGTGEIETFSVRREESLSRAFSRTGIGMFFLSPALIEAENSLAAFARS